MSIRIPGTLVALASVAVLVAACDDDPVGIEGPFSFNLIVQTGDAAQDVLVPGREIEIEVGQGMLIKVQVLDSRGNPPGIQAETFADNSNPRVLESVGASFDDEEDLARFTFRGLEPGIAPLAFSNPSAMIQAIVVVRVVEAS